MSKRPQAEESSKVDCNVYHDRQ